MRRLMGRKREHALPEERVTEISKLDVALPPSDLTGERVFPIRNLPVNEDILSKIVSVRTE